MFLSLHFQLNLMFLVEGELCFQLFSSFILGVLCLCFGLSLQGTNICPHLQHRVSVSFDLLLKQPLEGFPPAVLLLATSIWYLSSGCWWATKHLQFFLESSVCGQLWTESTCCLTPTTAPWSTCSWSSWFFSLSAHSSATSPDWLRMLPAAPCDWRNTLCLICLSCTCSLLLLLAWWMLEQDVLILSSSSWRHLSCKLGWGTLKVLKQIFFQNSWFGVMAMSSSHLEEGRVSILVYLS